MNLRDGDKLSIDDVEFEVQSSTPLGYWLKESGQNSYYYIMYKTTDELVDLFKVGRLKLGKLDKVEGGKTSCSHWNWKKYVGIREVYDYCTNCGAKRHKDWRLIKDEKDY